MEATYLSAVRSGNVELVKRILDVPPGLNINGTDKDQRSALTIAIEEGNLEMVKLLLQYDINVGDSLLHAVKVNFVEAVKILCEQSALAKEFGKDCINSFASGPDFPASLTALMVAAEYNDPDTIQILLQYGAKMPTLDDVTSRCSDSFSKSLGRLQYYQAISSPCYMVLACEDPVEDAFQVSQQIFHKSRDHEMKCKYDDISTKLISFVTMCLDNAYNEAEIGCILDAKHVTGSKNDRRIPKRLKLALQLEFKQYVAHPSVQGFLLNDWYLGFKSCCSMSAAKFLMVSLLIMVAFPFLSILYILIPFAFFVNFMKTPYIRFLLNTASQIFFLGLLICSTLTTRLFFDVSTTHFLNKDHEAEYLAYRGPPPSTLTLVIYIWIIGILWQQMRLVWQKGFVACLKNRWIWIDTVQLFLYLVFIAANTMAYFQAQALAEHAIERHLSTAPPMTQETPHGPILVPRSNTPGNALHVGTTKAASTVGTSTVAIAGVDLNGVLSASYGDESRLDWDGYDPLLVAEATFALANVFSFLGIMHSMVILGFVGPLQVSLSRILADILKFLLLFSLVWISFALGFTQLYQTFEVLERELCQPKQMAKCDPPAFDNFERSLDTLFWSLFGALKRNSINIAKDMPGVEHELKLTEWVGFVMYTIYLVVAVVILLNALIAMMTNTYNRIEQNADTEWMVARTSLMTEYMSDSTGTLPPPFNLIPSFHAIICLLIKTYHYVSDGVFILRLADYKPRKEEIASDKTEYEAIMRILKERYLRILQMQRARKKQAKISSTML